MAARFASAPTPRSLGRPVIGHKPRVGSPSPASRISFPRRPQSRCLSDTLEIMSALIFYLPWIPCRQISRYTRTHPLDFSDTQSRAIALRANCFCRM